MQLDLGLPTEVYARVALLVYTDHTGTQGLVMQHALREENGHPVMAEGVNVTQDTIDSILRLNAMQTLTFVPEHVVAVGTNAIAWISPAQDRRMLFQGAYDKAVAELDGQVLPQPRLLFIARGAHLYIYALPGTERPGASTPLYLVPYYNIFSNNLVCNGTMQRPQRLDVDSIPEWEHAFFYSNFVKPGDTQKRHAYPGTYRELWDAARAAGHFKDEWLVPAGKTLAEALGGPK